MSAELLLVLVVAAVVVYLVLGWVQRTGRTALGMGRGELAYADDTIQRRPTLRSERLQLAGRPDLLEQVDGAYIPVEHKPSARRLQQSHILQVAAQCMLVEDVYGVRPPYGVVVLADGARERVTFSAELERGVLRAMGEMRTILASGEPPGPVWSAAKCRACGFQPVCWDGADGRHAPVAATG